jgi:hypothetical protein
LSGGYRPADYSLPGIRRRINHAARTASGDTRGHRKLAPRPRIAAVRSGVP